MSCIFPLSVCTPRNSHHRRLGLCSRALEVANGEEGGCRLDACARGDASGDALGVRVIVVISSASRVATVMTLP